MGLYLIGSNANDWKRNKGDLQSGDTKKRETLAFAQ
jgi:hypothetical protein